MKAKSWARKQDPVLHPKNNRQMRVTVFGAISPCLQNGRVMRLARSTNKQDFMAFLVDIKTSILPMYRSETQILLFDGARAHTCRDSQEFMKDYFKGLQIPVMSCEFNCKYSHRTPAKTKLFFRMPIFDRKVTLNRFSVKKTRIICICKNMQS